MTSRWAIFLLLGCWGNCLGIATAKDADYDELHRRAATIRPTAAESLWTQIPWVRSAIDGQRQARDERRPIMYWHVDDDPLERC